MSLKECLLCNLELACLLGGLAAFIWLACQPPEKARTPRLLELFSGTGSIGRAFEAEGWEVASVDLDPRFRPTVCCDVMQPDERSLGSFDMVWASPVCTEYSRALSRRPRDLATGDRLVLRTLEIIGNLRPRWWAMENPQTGLLTRQRRVLLQIWV